MSTIPRKIYFYYLDVVEKKNDTSIPNVYNFFSEILQSERCSLHYPAEDCFVSITSQDTSLTKGQIINSRKDDLPQLESSRELSPLRLENNQGLANVTHFVLFNTNVVGVEFNFYGPRISKLKNFLKLFYEDQYSLEIRLMTSEDILEKIKKYGEIYSVDVQIRREVSHLMEKSDNPLFHIFKTIRQTTPADVLRFSGQIDKKKRDEKSFKTMIDPVLKKEYLDNPEFMDGMEIFKIKAKNKETDRIDDIDVLKDRLTETKAIKPIDTNHKAVDSNSMFNAIIEAYDDLKTEINKFIAR